MNLVFYTNEENERIDFLYLHPYHKYWISLNPKIKNTNVDEYSRKILDLKDKTAVQQWKRDRAIAYFLPQITPLLKNNDFLLCGAPSHEAGRNNGIYYLIEEICQCPSLSRVVKANDLILRKYTIPSEHEGGERDEEAQKKSMMLNISKYDIQGKNVLVLDDVTTTGATLWACEELLQEGGAAKIKMLALGKACI